MNVENDPSSFSTPPANFNPGLLLNGRYKIKSELGRGGMGIVYLAHDEQILSRKVVVKLLMEFKTQDDWVLRKFYQEMEALSRIDHPGVVGLLDHGRLPDGQPFLVMQYVEGETLRSLIRPEGLEFDRVALIVKQIAEALEAAHQQNVLHRDLKPENVMLQRIPSGDDKVKLIDFGLAKVKNSQVGQSTVMPSVAGSYGYMAPEQLMAKTATPQSDVYSLAVIAYELLTGRRPFMPESPFELLEMQRNQNLLKPSILRPAINPETEATLAKALSFDPQKRHSSVLEFNDDFIRSLQSGRPVERASVPVYQANLKTRAGTPVPQVGTTAVQLPGEKSKLSVLAFGLMVLAQVFSVLALKKHFFAFDGISATFIAAATGLFLLLVTVAMALRNNKVAYTIVAAVLALTLLPFALTKREIITAAETSGLPVETARMNLVYSDHRGVRYTMEENFYSIVEIDPGTFNALKDYTLKLRLSPEIEFADIYFDQQFGITDQLSLQPSSTNDILVVKKEGDSFRRPRKIFVLYKYRVPASDNRIDVALTTPAGDIVQTHTIAVKRP